MDGYVARRFNQTSTFGAMFDPTVDRLLMLVGIVSVIIDHSAPLWFVWIILVREVFTPPSSWRSPRCRSQAHGRDLVGKVRDLLQHDGLPLLLVRRGGIVDVHLAFDLEGNRLRMCCTWVCVRFCEPPGSTWFEVERRSR